MIDLVLIPCKTESMINTLICNDVTDGQKLLMALLTMDWYHCKQLFSPTSDKNLHNILKKELFALFLNYDDKTQINDNFPVWEF